MALIFYTYRENSVDEEDLAQKTTKQETLNKRCKAKQVFSSLHVCYIANNNKEPYLTVEFYKSFWSEIGTFVVDLLNYAHFHGELSNLQMQALITLIEKKNKDRG